MVQVHFVRPSGDEEAHDLLPGSSVMEGALNNGIGEIVADCGGALSCATCHVYVADSWFGQLEPASGAEAEMLDFAVDRRPNSRLSCQIVVNESLDGIIIELPERQQ